MVNHKSPKPNQPWRHHYIPEFYLKRWMPSGDRLTQFSRPYGALVRAKKVYPRQTGFVDRLYELSGLPTELSQQLETGFYHPVDTHAALVIEKMERDQYTFTLKERVGWARFLISLKSRLPEEIAAARKYFTLELKRTDDETERRYAGNKKAWEPNTFSEFMDLPGNAERVVNEAITVMVTHANNENVINTLIGMKWGGLYFPSDVPDLLTSDRPIIWDGPLEDPDCIVVLPTGPKSLFYAYNSPQIRRGLELIDCHMLICRINLHVVSRAVKFCYGTSEQSLDFVQQFMSSEKIDTLAEQVIKLRSDRAAGVKR